MASPSVPPTHTPHNTHTQANIKESRFGLDFIRSKDIVLNGLDNLDARRHVNRLCVAAGTPLIESGTAGHRGQVRLTLLVGSLMHVRPPCFQSVQASCALHTLPR